MRIIAQMLWEEGRPLDGMRRPSYSLVRPGLAEGPVGATWSL